MYQPHSVVWFGLGFVACIVAVAVLALLIQLKKVQLSQRVLLGIALAGLANIIALQAIQNYDNKQLLQEWIGMDPDKVSDVRLKSEKQTRNITNAADIRLLFSEFKLTSTIAAHHSHPTDLIELSFQMNQNQFRYAIGRDSERSNEYWVRELARSAYSGREIGRIQSERLGQILQALLAGQIGVAP